MCMYAKLTSFSRYVATGRWVKVTQKIKDGAAGTDMFAPAFIRSIFHLNHSRNIMIEAYLGLL